MVGTRVACENPFRSEHHWLSGGPRQFPVDCPVSFEFLSIGLTKSANASTSPRNEAATWTHEAALLIIHSKPTSGVSTITNTMF